ncbi:MAG TPA: CotH kinase family protein, partial [Acetivibrio sp.]|nr:CotH kinase family protein [Acetivibrio sp.]
MINSKGINVIVAIAVAFAVVLSAALVVAGNMQKASGSLKSEPEYANKVFGTDIISIDILADEEDWQEMLDNARSEQFIMVDVVINGTRFKNVGIRPKGNSSLTQVASSDSDRYSFRLQFDEYIKDQTCFGLESMVLNNMLGDSTYMKEYVSYDLMREIGVDAPYFGYADIKINGESHGLYLAVELYNDSYEQRVFGNTSGMLYNVKSMDMGNWDGNVPGAPGGGMPSMFEGGMPGMFGNFGDRGWPGGSRGGGSLEYTDDNIESYSSIFNNVVGKGKESDYQRVIQALKALSEGKELEKYFDVDKILRYLAAHTFVVNLDSYSSSMAQNYYIYERDGKLTVLPWDYNLAWGGFQNGDATSVINFPIDTPVSGVEMSSRPLIEKLFSNAEYLERYHSYLQQLIGKYLANGKFEGKIKSLDAVISEYVKNDATAFCTFDEYQNAVSAFITLGNLRAQSVQGQLDGTVPSTTEGQKANPEKLISSGDLKLSVLGSMMGGRGGRDNT